MITEIIIEDADMILTLGGIYKGITIDKLGFEIGRVIINDTVEVAITGDMHVATDKGDFFTVRNNIERN